MHLCRQTGPPYLKSAGEGTDKVTVTIRRATERPLFLRRLRRLPMIIIGMAGAGTSVVGDCCQGLCRFCHRPYVKGNRGRDSVPFCTFREFILAPNAGGIDLWGIEQKWEFARWYKRVVSAVDAGSAGGQEELCNN